MASHTPPICSAVPRNAVTAYYASVALHNFDVSPGIHRLPLFFLIGIELKSTFSRHLTLIAHPSNGVTPSESSCGLLPPNSGEIDPVLSLDVEHHSPAGEHVSWESGIPDGRLEISSGKHTHCSAFVAAAAKRADVYVLRPPEHQQILLANAQYDWLATDGKARGWKPIADGIQAQHYANQGWLVLAAYRNHHDEKPGHVAIVRPSDKEARAVREEGPQITQAGTINYRSVALRVGFAGHPAAWEHHKVVYYAHPVDPAAISQHILTK